MIGELRQEWVPTCTSLNSVFGSEGNMITMTILSVSEERHNQVNARGTETK